MTELLERALETVRELPDDAQDEIARVILHFIGLGDDEPVQISPQDRAAIALSKVAAARGEFATDDQVAAVWRKYE